jgi:hypothetical protein
VSLIGLSAACTGLARKPDKTRARPAESGLNDLRGFNDLHCERN